MDPWTIIGWLVLLLVGSLGLRILLVVLIKVVEWVRIYIRSYRCRSIQPREGQIWVGSDSRFNIRHIYDDGRVCIWIRLPGGGDASWSDSPQEWRARVKRRHLWLANR